MHCLAVLFVFCGFVCFGVLLFCWLCWWGGGGGGGGGGLILTDNLGGRRFGVEYLYLGSY